MTHMHAKACDYDLLVRYLDGDLEPHEKEKLEDHLDGCRQCRQQLTALSNFSQDFRLRVQGATDAVDFTVLEKEVLNKALRQHRFHSGAFGFFASLKYILPATVTVGLLFFFGYTHFMAKPTPLPAPSAIINTFTGSMSSVMIFETPETRQTILWYNEATDMESEHNAV